MREEILYTMRLEGGYSDQPDDRGGITKFGISKKAFPNLNISTLTVEQAISIYQENYWNKIPLLNQITDIRLRWKLFDIGVNCGVGYAVSQTAGMQLNLLSIDTLIEIQVRHYTNIVVREVKMSNTHTQVDNLSGWINRAFERGLRLLMLAEGGMDKLEAKLLTLVKPNE